MSVDKLLTKFHKEVKQLEKLHRAALDAGKVDSKQKKVVTTAFIELLKGGGFGYGTKIRVNDVLYTYGPTVTESVSPEAWLDLYEKKVISRTMFLKAISVSKTAADKAAGQDIVLRVSEKQTGKTSDLRTEKFAGTYTKELQIIAPEISKIKKRVPMKNIATTKPILKRKIKLVAR